MNKSVKTSDGLDHQYILEEKFNQVDAHTVFTAGEQPHNPVA